jgi:hypothetical protein
MNGVRSPEAGYERGLVRVFNNHQIWFLNLETLIFVNGI